MIGPTKIQCRMYRPDGMLLCRCVCVSVSVCVCVALRSNLYTLGLVLLVAGLIRDFENFTEIEFKPRENKSLRIYLFPILGADVIFYDSSCLLLEGLIRF